MSIFFADILDHLRDEGGLQDRDIANAVQAPRAMVSRWVAGTAIPDLRTQTMSAGLRYVVDRLADFYTPDEIRHWLHAPHQLLNGDRAIELINAGRTQEIFAAIDALEIGK